MDFSSCSFIFSFGDGYKTFDLLIDDDNELDSNDDDEFKKSFDDEYNCESELNNENEEEDDDEDEK